MGNLFVLGEIKVVLEGHLVCGAIEEHLRTLHGEMHCQNRLCVVYLGWAKKLIAFSLASSR